MSVVVDPCQPNLDRTGVAAVVLAGGGSRRFGTDKTMAQWAGRTLLDHVVGSIEALVDEVYVVGPWAPAGVTHGVEADRGLGPLAALAHGLAQVAAPVALVVAADHPLLQPSLCRLLLEVHRDTGADVVVARNDGRLEPLVACYRTSLAADAAALVDGGERRLTALIDRVDAVVVEPDRWRSVDPAGLSFRDADTPEELTRLVELSRRSTAATTSGDHPR